MRITRLKSENVMRLVAVDITPDGNLITIGGKNGAGKSSVLNSIAMALGGAALVPEEPLRQGEASGKIEVAIDKDFLVTRTFTRAKLEDGSWGPTDSKLMVTNPHGAPYPSPQTLLNKLLGKLTFDPLAFAQADEKPQYEMLRTLVGVDVSGLEQKRQNAYAQRSVLNKSHDIKSAQLMRMPSHKDVPAEVQSVDAITAELTAAEQKQTAATKADAEYVGAMQKLTAIESDQRVSKDRIARLEIQLADERTALQKADEAHESQQNEVNQADQRRQLAKSEVPDMTAIKTKLVHLETVNQKVRENQSYATAAAEVEKIGFEAKAQDQIVKDCEDAKIKALSSVTFPVEGLGLTEAGVTYNGLPFKQASTSEQIRASVAIAIAMNPTLKVLLIRNGNALDEDSLKAVAAQADTAGAQVWMEYVTKDAGAVSILIEDGHGTLAQPKVKPAVVKNSEPEIDVPFQLG